MWGAMNNQGKAGLAIAGILAAAVMYLAARTSPPPITFTEAGSAQQSPAASAVEPPASVNAPPPSKNEVPNERASELVVHVAGRVKSPGVYRLAPGSRVADALKAAGGELADADTESLNLAARVIDGKQLFVPRRLQTASTKRGVTADRESPAQRVDPSYLPERLASARAVASSSGRNSGSPASPAKFHNPGDGVVHLNSASIEQLQRLPGVGPATAQKIADYRRETGKFTQIDEIMRVRGIGPKKYAKMRPFLAL